MQDLRGKTALVTGGSRGIGRAICLELASRGADVAVNYHSRAAAAEKTVAAVRSLGVSALAIQADISRRAEAGTMAKQVTAELGPPDILVNNAGLLYAGELLDYDEDEFDQMWRTNVKGVLYCSEALAPEMIRRGWGRIVNLASNAAIGTAMAGDHALRRDERGGAHANKAHGLRAVTQGHHCERRAAGIHQDRHGPVGQVSRRGGPAAPERLRAFAGGSRRRTRGHRTPDRIPVLRGEWISSPGNS